MKKTSKLVLAAFIVITGTYLWLELQKNLTGNNAVDTNAGTADYLLALSWQPAFCEQRPNKPECRSQRDGRFDTHNFSLHGLWPQPRNNTYCGVPSSLVALDKSGRWRDLPKLDLTDALRKELVSKMPGYRSALHRHEWYKHGTCMAGASAQRYFEISLTLLDDLNRSAFVRFVNEHVGKRVAFRELEAAFVRAFGKVVSGKMIVDCYRDDGRRIVQDLKLSIRADLLQEVNLKTGLASGDEVGRSCPGGIIDPVGLQ